MVNRDDKRPRRDSWLPLLLLFTLQTATPAWAWDASVTQSFPSSPRRT